jgi:hypothetical protein
MTGNTLHTAESNPNKQLEQFGTTLLTSSSGSQFNFFDAIKAVLEKSPRGNLARV